MCENEPRSRLKHDSQLTLLPGKRSSKYMGSQANTFQNAHPWQKCVMTRALEHTLKQERDQNTEIPKFHNYATRSTSLQHLNPESFRINLIDY